MGVFALRTAVRDGIWSEIVVADLDGARAESFARGLADSRVRAVPLDVTEAAALARAVDAADVVLNCVGPYYRFGVPILDACLGAGCHYLDLNDDWEPTLEMLALDERARDAGVSAVLGMGASPGLTNLLAVMAARELDRVDTLDTIWGLGEKGLRGPLGELRPGEGGSHGAATEHWVQQLTGTIRVVRDGALVETRPLQAVGIDYPGHPPVTCHGVGHPEPITLLRAHPGLRSSRNLMDMPAALIALLRRVAARVDQGACSVREGAREIEAVTEAGPLRMLLSRTGLGLLLELMRGAPHLPSLCALATGEADGQRLRVGAALTAAPAGGMGGITGVPAGIGLGLLARGQLKRRGVVAPEEAFEPDEVMKALAPHCRDLPPGSDRPVRITRAAA